MLKSFLCAATLLAACVDTKDPAYPCGTLGQVDRDLRVQCMIHADLQAIEKRLQPPKMPKVVPPKCPTYDPDEVCDGECEAARGAAKEYERKYRAMCDLATAMCLSAKQLGHWEDDCEHVCVFFGDGPVEKGDKQ